MSEPKPPDYPHVKVIAHRGNSSQAPENTRAAFQQAIDLNVDFIECDVQLSKDGVPVVLHDHTIHRIMENCVVCDVNSLNWGDLQNVDAGSWFHHSFAEERVLSLEEFLLMPKGKVGAMIEIKQETFFEYGLAKIVAVQIAETLPKLKNHGPVIVGSLNPQVLLALEACLPQQVFIAVLDDVKKLDDFLPIRAKYYGLKYDIATKELIKDLQKEGKEVWAWTVDDKTIAKKLIDRGIQGLITNHPKKMQQIHVSPNV